MSTKHIYDAIKALETEFGSVERVNRNRYVSIAMGAIAASVATLPTAPMAAPTNHFLLQHEGNIKWVFSDVNELYIFDINLALKVARQVYLMRYRRVYDPELILAELTGEYNAVPVIAELKEVFNDQTLTADKLKMYSGILIPSLTVALGAEG